MILEKGNMWSIWKKTDYFLVTTNSTLNSNGDLVMGAGIAKELKEKVPGIERRFAKCMKHGHLGEYGLIIIPVCSINQYSNRYVGAFQVKHHWKHLADIKLIEESASILQERAILFYTLRFDLNFPGIGLGGLKRKDVLPIIKELPNNVHVWEK